MLIFSDDEVETVGGLLLQEMGLVSDLQGQIIELGKIGNSPL